MEEQGFQKEASPADFKEDMIHLVTVTVPYETVAEYMKSKYCGIHGAGVAHFPVNETIWLNLSGVKYETKTYM